MGKQKIKVAILGVGNCASSFVQGIHYYTNNDKEDGLISDVIGGYKVSDIEVVAAYDINKSKVGKDLGDAIFSDPNNTMKFATHAENYKCIFPTQLLSGADGAQKLSL